MRFTLIFGSLIVLILVCIFAFLLFRTEESSNYEANTELSSEEENVTPLLIPNPITHDPDVSQEIPENELPLGTDINMEFPTLEE